MQNLIIMLFFPARQSIHNCVQTTYKQQLTSIQPPGFHSFESKERHSRLNGETLRSNYIVVRTWTKVHCKDCYLADSFRNSRRNFLTCSTSSSVLDAPAKMLTDFVGDIILEDPGPFSFPDLAVAVRSKVELFPRRLTWLREIIPVPRDMPREWLDFLGDPVEEADREDWSLSVKGAIGGLRS